MRTLNWSNDNMLERANCCLAAAWIAFAILVLCPTVGSSFSHDTAPIASSGLVPVFYAGYNGSKCYRIPSIIETSQGTLLAFAENRITDCGDNSKEHVIVLRRSKDGGKSWGDMITVAVDEKPPCDGCPSAISNPNPVQVTFPNGTEAILLHYDTLNNPRKSAHGLDMQTWSFDDGLSWEEGAALAYPPSKNVGGLIGPSIGIQARNGSIFFSAQDFLNGHFLYFSDDYGKTWHASESFGSDLSECSIAFIPRTDDSTIMMNCRTGSHKRAQFIWANRTKPSQAQFFDGLIDSNCQGSLVTHRDAVYLSNTNSTAGRQHMVVKKTTDGGKTWNSGTLVWGGPAAYSQLVSMSSGELGLLFEAGIKSAYETISFILVPDKAKQAGHAIKDPKHV